MLELFMSPQTPKNTYEQIIPTLWGGAAYKKKNVYISPVCISQLLCNLGLKIGMHTNKQVL